MLPSQTRKMMVKWYLPELEVSLFMIVAVARDGKASLADPALVGLVPRVRAHMRNHRRPLEGVEAAALTLIAGCAVKLWRRVQVKGLYM